MKAIPVLHYEELGHGPVVVLLHGYMASSRYWHRVIQDLAQNHRVIAIDLLGFGKSPKPACSRYDYDVQLNSINVTLEKLQISEAFTLVGHSMGSLVALRYARNNQHRVRKLILTNMPIFLNRVDAKQEILGTNLFYRFGLQPGLHSVFWFIFRISVYLRLIPNRIAEGAVNRKSYMFQNTAVSRLRSMRNVILAAKIETDLYALQMKTVIISGVNDRQRYLQNLTTFKLNKNIFTQALQGGHHLPLTKPEIISTLV